MITKELEKKARSKKNVFHNKNNKGNMLLDKKEAKSFLSNVEEDLTVSIMSTAKKEELIKDKINNALGMNTFNTISDYEARYLVNNYYSIQKYRIQAMNQARKVLDPTLHPEFSITNLREKYPNMEDDQLLSMIEPHNLSQYIGENMELMEKLMADQLGEYAMSKPCGRWLRSLTGIGPILSAGLLANIPMEHDIYDKPYGKKNRKIIGRRRVASAVQLQRFAGYDPTITWNAGEVRPFNATLKTLFYKCGESFIKTKSKSFYGPYYDQKRQELDKLNEEGFFKEYAINEYQKRYSNKAIRGRVEDEDFETNAEVYASGKLPKSHIYARCRRHIIKLFISHVWQVFYENTFHEESARPYAIEHLGHCHYIAPPNYDIEHRKEFGLWIPNK